MTSNGRIACPYRVARLVSGALVLVLLGVSTATAWQAPPANPAPPTDPVKAPAAEPPSTPADKPVLQLGDKVQVLRFVERKKQPKADEPPSPSPAATKLPAAHRTGDGVSQKAPMISRQPRNPNSEPPAGSAAPGRNLVKPAKPVPVPAKQATPPPRPKPEANSLPADLAAQSKPAVRDTLDDVHAASFQAITPGKSTVAEVENQLGEPKSRDNQGDDTTLTYQVGPFPKVEILAESELVHRVVIHLKQPAETKKISGELGLDAFEWVGVPGRGGRIIGQAFPERGVLFVYARQNDSAATATSPRVGQIVLEPITADTFVLRAQSDTSGRHGANLSDLRFARELQPDHAEAWWGEAELLDKLGRSTAAIKSAKKALQLNPEQPRYQLTAARLHGQLGQFEKALNQTREVIDNKKTPAWVAAQALVQLGDLQAAGARDYESAARNHMEAVSSAKRLMNHQSKAVREAALRTLVDANLGVAIDIGWGSWKDKQTTIPKWLDQAERVAQTLHTEYHDPLAVWKVRLGSLEAQAGTPLMRDLKVDLQQLKKLHGQIVGFNADPLLRETLDWQYGAALFDAARITYEQGSYRTARELAMGAAEAMEPVGSNRDAGRRDYLLGRVYFLVGVTYALADKDHEQSVVWYEKATPRLESPKLVVPPGELGRHGERLVTMGVSYWKSDARTEAVRITEAGVEFIEKAVQVGAVERQTLVVPYSNLVSMHRTLGNDEKAEALTARAAKISARRE